LGGGRGCKGEKILNFFTATNTKGEREGNEGRYGGWFELIDATRRSGGLGGKKKNVKERPTKALPLDKTNCKKIVRLQRSRGKGEKWGGVQRKTQEGK